MKRIIVWLRNDLRVHDNPALDWAVRYGGKAKEILPVYSFDPRFMSHKVEKYGTQKCGLIRARFIRESVVNMREKLESLGSHLLVTTEKPEDFLPRLLRPDIDNTLVYQQEICKEELDIEAAVK
jgi:deoxyribodipyrimidine photo-lyase